MGADQLQHTTTAEAAQAGVLIDGAPYFKAFRSALARAKKSIYILAWDIHSQLKLIPEDSDEDGPSELGAFFHHLLEKTPSLQIHLLCWDFSVVYATEREWRLTSRHFRDPHPRLHLHYDNALPLGASHHQKMVVVDDKLAFLGGIDLGLWRWDTPEHLYEDSRRTNPDGERYPPFHDAQMVVNGAAARMLGDLARERWKRATDEALEPPDSESPDTLWPEGVDASFEAVEVRLIRSQAAFDSFPERREGLANTLEIIESAKDYLYLENQYLSSPDVGEALEASLQREEGPEILLILTQNTNGWLEEGTLGVVRDRILERLAEADRHDRFRVWFPESVGEAGERAQIYVHTKLIIADDRVLRLGSSNLSNRSMKVDTEADLFLSFEQAHPGLRDCLARFLAILSGVSTETVEEARTTHGSLLQAVDSLQSPERNGLRPFSFGLKHDWQRKLADSRLLDPDEPVDPGYWIQQHVDSSKRASVWKRLLLFGLAAGALLATGLALKWGWGQYVDQDAVTSLLDDLKGSPWTPLWVTLVFAIGSTVAIPLNLILVGAALAFGPWWALLYGLLGAHLSAITAFSLGRTFGQPLVRRISSENLDRLSQKIGEHGAPSVAVVRIVPVAPFLVVNLLAGASHLEFRPFLLGSLLGMIPGMLGVVFLTSRIEAALRDPGAGSFALLGGAVALVAGAFFFLRKRLSGGDSSAS